jgi:hypothetical protein
MISLEGWQYEKKKDVQGWLRAAEEWWERDSGSSNQSCADLAAVEAPKVS